MSKAKREKIILITFGLLVITGWFYWFQYRPTKIRHDCSWTRHYEEAKPATEGRTEEELWQDGALEDCTSSLLIDRYTTFDAKRFCERSNEFIINENKPKQARPEKEWYSKATEKEYLFCLHDKGLK